MIFDLNWFHVAAWTGHSKMFYYQSSLLPQAQEPASKLMRLEADPDLEKVRLSDYYKAAKA